IYVKKGFVLARLETVDYQADYDRTRAQADSAHQRWRELDNGFRTEEKGQAKADLEEAQAQVIQLKLAWDRSLDLKRKGQASSPGDLEQAESAYKAMDSRVKRLKWAYDLMLNGNREERIKAAEAEWKQWEAEAVKAKWKLDNCVVVAPVSGTI